MFSGYRTERDDDDDDEDDGSPLRACWCTFPVYPSYDRTASVAVCQWRCQLRCNRVGEESPLSHLRSPSKIGRGGVTGRKSRRRSRQRHRRDLRGRDRENRHVPVVARTRRQGGGEQTPDRQSRPHRVYQLALAKIRLNPYYSCSSSRSKPIHAIAFYIPCGDKDRGTRERGCEGCTSS